MRDVLPELERWHREGKPIAIASVISIVGSAPRGVGATLALTAAGDIAGSVSGGCVEPAVIEVGLKTLRTGQPKLLSYGITEEQNVEQIGLSCGGQIEVFVERLANLEPLAATLKAQQPIVRAVVINAPAEGDATPGASMLIPEQGALTGSSGDPALDDAVATRARDLLREGESAMATVEIAEKAAQIFFAVYPPEPTLVIVGAGHITIPLTRLAKTLDYHVTVIDPREAFATRERIPDADDLLLEWPDEALAHLPVSSATAVAVLTHDDKFDVPALKAALNSPATYVGAIGSRGTRERRDRRLREAGVTDEQIGRIHGPIGINIGAQTPEEIALAILAQIVAVRRGKDKG
ncbi:MAG TPA: XdhC family protein [Ktedonobacterales bacterium]|nr:XdhC family protein [Ktedonobacterales bacterium]